MSVLDVCSEDRHFMVMTLQKRRNHHLGLATAGQSGAAVPGVVVGRRRRRPQNLNRKRKRNSSGEEIM